MPTPAPLWAAFIERYLEFLKGTQNVNRTLTLAAHLPPNSSTNVTRNEALNGVCRCVNSFILNAMLKDVPTELCSTFVYIFASVFLRYCLFSSSFVFFVPFGKPAKPAHSILPFGAFPKTSSDDNQRKDARRLRSQHH
jgi:hypothetical protein